MYYSEYAQWIPGLLMLFILQMSFQSLKLMLKDVRKSMLFFLVNCDFDIEKRIQMVNRMAFCRPSHLVRASHDKGILYEKCYSNLENRIVEFLLILKRKTNTRRVHGFITQVDNLLGKLRRRKSHEPSKLTKKCLKNIKAYVYFDFD
ncbi:hypothetical protein MHBO_005224 [Bonamia ostreae]|uniref:Uncharacterized protein n=1 Tax=Bonamia ostreae TaxID=126728 RepID=A0ABV2AVE8_9EUKA